MACPESCVWSSRGTSPHDPGVGAQTGPTLGTTHTCADAVRTGHSLSTHTIREHSRAREEEGGSREIAHDSDDGVEQAARSCEPTATRAFGVSAIWLDRTFCYPCCPPLLTLKDNLHSRCAAISDETRSYQHVHLYVLAHCVSKTHTAVSQHKIFLPQTSAVEVYESVYASNANGTKATLWPFLPKRAI